MMEMGDTIFYWTGAFVWYGLGLAAAWLLLEILYALACTISWCRWSYYLMRAHNTAPPWRSLPRTLLTRWREFIGYRPGTLTWSGPGGQWRGIGRWKVVPPSDLPGQQG